MYGNGFNHDVSGQTPLLLELEDIAKMDKLGLSIVEFFLYTIGINLAPEKRSSFPCRVVHYVAVSLTSIMLFGLIVQAYNQFGLPFMVYAEAVILTFQTTAALMKMFYFNTRLPEILKLLHISKSGALLHDLGIFDLDLPNKVELSKEIGDILRKSWRDSNEQVVFFFKTIFTPVMWYIVRPYFQYIYDCYFDSSKECEMSMTYPSRLPYVKLNGHEYPSFIARFMVLQMGPYYNGLTVFALISVFIIMTVHEVGMLRVLRYLVRISTDDTRVPKGQRLEYAQICVRLFVRITRHHAKIEDMFKYIILAQCIISSMLICMLLYNVSLGTELELGFFGMFICYLIAMMIEISLYNFDGQQVQTESDELGFDWYGVAWYNECHEFRYIVKMMIMFSNRTLVLSVGGFTNLSLKLLLLVFRMSGNFFLLLRNVNESN